MTPAEAAKAVAVLAAAYPGARWSSATVEVYELMLADLEFDLVRNAVARLICSSKFLPTVAEVREAAADISVGPARSGIDAWGDVTLAIRRVGYMDAPKFKDPLVADCVRIMGWRNLCLGETPEGVDRANFAKLYDERAKRQRMQDVSEPGRLLPAAPRERLSGVISKGTTEPVAGHEIVRLCAGIGKSF